MRGYRGFVKEFARTRSAKAFWLQVRGGFLHLLRARDTGADGVAKFLRNYGPEGFQLPDDARRARAAAAQRCLVCGLCSAECARVGGTPPVDPMEAVVATSRLTGEAKRLGLVPDSGDPCGKCRACEAVCPVAIPIAEITGDFG